MEKFTIDLILFVALFGFGDVLSTWFFLSRGGWEANPLGRGLLKRYGFKGLIYLKLALMPPVIIFSLALVELIGDPVLLRFGAIAGLFLTIWNIFSTSVKGNKATRKDEIRLVGIMLAGMIIFKGVVIFLGSL